ASLVSIVYFPLCCSCSFCLIRTSLFFFSTPSPPTDIFSLSLHDALPISAHLRWRRAPCRRAVGRRRCPGTTGHRRCPAPGHLRADRKSTRLNSSHVKISYAVFCLKKKTKNKKQTSKV